MDKLYWLARMGMLMLDEPADDGGSDEPASDDTAPEADADAGDDGTDAESLEQIDKQDAWDPSRAMEKIRKLNAEVRAAKDKAAKAAEDKAKGSDDLTKENASLKAENLRLRVGNKYHLPDELIERLRGDTEEEILADAEKLLALMGAEHKNPDAGHIRGGGSDPSRDDDVDPDKIAAAIPRL